MKKINAFAIAGAIVAACAIAINLQNTDVAQRYEQINIANSNAAIVQKPVKDLPLLGDDWKPLPAKIGKYYWKDCDEEYNSYDFSPQAQKLKEQCRTERSSERESTGRALMEKNKNNLNHLAAVLNENVQKAAHVFLSKEDISDDSIFYVLEQMRYIAYDQGIPVKDISINQNPWKSFRGTLSNLVSYGNTDTTNGIAAFISFLLLVPFLWVMTWRLVGIAVRTAFNEVKK